LLFQGLKWNQRRRKRRAKVRSKNFGDLFKREERKSMKRNRRERWKR
jgi:hypothetical protein